MSDDGVWQGADLTVGVEEEFLLVDHTGHLSARGSEVIEAVAEPEGELQRELTRCQLESATGICHSADELLYQLRGMRKRLAEQAAGRGLRLLPSGTPVLAEEFPPETTPLPRYHRIAEHFGAIATTMIVCSCHVHVAIPDRATGVLISNHLRPWLPILLALTANSPYHEGRDTRYCSWRHVQWSRWPSAGPPPFFASPAQYDDSVDAMLRSGAMLDRRMVYWDIRLSENQPTLEFRACDVAGTAAEAALLGAIIRGLVAVACHNIEDRRPASNPPHEVLRADLWRAARDGLGGRCAHPGTGRLTSMRGLLDHLAEHILPALRASPDNDLEFVTAGLAALRESGGGAQRQRTAFAKRRRHEDVIDMLTYQADR